AGNFAGARHRRRKRRSRLRASPAAARFLRFRRSEARNEFRGHQAGTRGGMTLMRWLRALLSGKACNCPKTPLRPQPTLHEFPLLLRLTVARMVHSFQQNEVDEEARMKRTPLLLVALM